MKKLVKLIAGIVAIAVIAGCPMGASTEVKSLSEVSAAEKTLKTPSVKLKGGKYKMVIKYKKKMKGAKGFQIKYVYNKKKVTKKTYKINKPVKITINNLKDGVYKVRIRAFAKKNGKKIYSKWTKAQYVKVTYYKVETNNKSKTIELNKATTYNGFKGYFTLDDNVLNVDLVKYGVTTDETDKGALFCSEYYDITTGNVIYYACSEYTSDSDFMEPIDYGPGRASVGVKVK